MVDCGRPVDLSCLASTPYFRQLSISGKQRRNKGKCGSCFCIPSFSIFDSSPPCNRTALRYPASHSDSIPKAAKSDRPREVKIASLETGASSREVILRQQIKNKNYNHEQIVGRGTNGRKGRRRRRRRREIIKHHDNNHQVVKTNNKMQAA